jgi:hypothetical protein
MSMLSHCEPYIAAALARGGEGFTFADVVREVEAGQAILWPGLNSAAVTYVRPMKAMHVWTAGGDLGELLEMARAAEVLSRNLGCDAIMAGGRDGWARALRPLGWNSYVLKELSQ